MIMYQWVSYMRKINLFFCVLEVTEERSQIRSWIRIRIQLSEVRIRGSGSEPKCYRSPTLVARNNFYSEILEGTLQSDNNCL
jgi:hypothetical protein